MRSGEGQQDALVGVQHSSAAGIAHVPITKNSFDVLGHIPTDSSIVATSHEIINIALGANPIGGNDYFGGVECYRA